MKTNRTSRFAIPLIVALLVVTAFSFSQRPAAAETPQAPDLHGSCVFAVQDWHNTEYLQAPGCFVTQGGGQSVKSIERERDQTSLIPTTVVVDVPPIIDNGGETIPDTETPIVTNGCTHPNVNRNGKLTCAKLPDTNSGQQNNTNHGGSSHTPKEPMAPKDNKKNK